MQNIFRNFSVIIFLLSLLTSQPVYSQDHTEKLFLADSLYKQGRYLEAHRHYRQILDSGKSYSPQMLLKMAYTEEALKHFTNSMYYLNLYYLKHPNRAVLKKMDEVARANGLTGYEYRDADFFFTQFKKYYMKMLELLLIGAVIVVTFLVLKPGWAFFKTAFFRAGFLLYFVLLLVYINLLSFNRKAIIKNPQAALMAGPSAGATWLATLQAGNRLAITGEEDIWFKVDWKNGTGFIRKSNLLLLPE